MKPATSAESNVLSLDTIIITLNNFQAEATFKLMMKDAKLGELETKFETVSAFSTLEALACTMYDASLNVLHSILTSRLTPQQFMTWTLKARAVDFPAAKKAWAIWSEMLKEITRLDVHSLALKAHNCHPLNVANNMPRTTTVSAAIALIMESHQELLVHDPKSIISDFFLLSILLSLIPRNAQTSGVLQPFLMTEAKDVDSRHIQALREAMYTHKNLIIDGAPGIAPAPQPSRQQYQQRQPSGRAAAASSSSSLFANAATPSPSAPFANPTTIATPATPSSAKSSTVKPSKGASAFKVDLDKALCDRCNHQEPVLKICCPVAWTCKSCGLKGPCHLPNGPACKLARGLAPSKPLRLGNAAEPSGNSARTASCARVPLFSSSTSELSPLLELSDFPDFSFVAQPAIFAGMRNDAQTFEVGHCTATFMHDSSAAPSSTLPSRGLATADSGATTQCLLEASLITVDRRMRNDLMVIWGDGSSAFPLVSGYARLTLIGEDEAKVDVELYAWGIKGLATSILSAVTLAKLGVVLHVEKGNTSLDFTRVGGSLLRIRDDCMLEFERTDAKPPPPAAIAVTNKVGKACRVAKSSRARHPSSRPSGN